MKTPRCPHGMHVQALIFHRTHYPTRREVKRWLHEHGYHARHLKLFESTIHATQHPASHFDGNRFRAAKWSPAITAVYGCPKAGLFARSKEW